MILTLQMFCGLQYLHSLSLIHRDIKPENLLVEYDDGGKPSVCITDFGLATFEKRRTGRQPNVAGESFLSAVNRSFSEALKKTSRHAEGTRQETDGKRIVTMTEKD